MIVLLASGDTPAAGEAEALLTAARYAAVRLASPEALLDRAVESGYGLALLFGSLQPEKPLSALYLLKSLENPAPVFFINDLPQDPLLHVPALEAGADDAVTAPVPPRELLARVRNLVRRAAPATPRPAWRGLALDTERLRLLYRENTVSLTRKQSALMETLLRKPEVLHTQAALMAALWPDRKDPDVLFTNVSGLRRALASLGCPHRLRLYRGEGYLLTAPPD